MKTPKQNEDSPKIELLDQPCNKLNLFCSLRIAQYSRLLSETQNLLRILSKLSVANNNSDLFRYKQHAESVEQNLLLLARRLVLLYSHKYTTAIDETTSREEIVAAIQRYTNQLSVQKFKQTIKKTLWAAVGVPKILINKIWRYKNGNI